MGRAGDHLARGAAHLLQLGHEIVFGLQAAGGVHQDVIDFAGFGGLHGIEKHRAGVAAGALPHYLDAGALSPDFELVDGGGAERVGGAEQD